MRKVVLQAQVELCIPSVLDPAEYDLEMYTKRPHIKMNVRLEMKDVVLREPSGRTITLKHLVINHITGVLIPVVEGDKVALFKADEADKPIVVEG